MASNKNSSFQWRANLLSIHWLPSYSTAITVRWHIWRLPSVRSKLWGPRWTFIFPQVCSKCRHGNKYFHREANEEETNQLEDNECLSPDHITPTPDIYNGEILEEGDMSEAKKTTSCYNPSSTVPRPHQCKWCHLVAKCVTNSSSSEGTAYETWVVFGIFWGNCK